MRQTKILMLPEAASSQPVRHHSYHPQVCWNMRGSLQQRASRMPSARRRPANTTHVIAHRGSDTRYHTVHIDIEAGGGTQPYIKPYIELMSWKALQVSACVRKQTYTYTNKVLAYQAAEAYAHVQCARVRRRGKEKARGKLSRCVRTLHSGKRENSSPGYWQSPAERSVAHRAGPPTYTRSSARKE